MSRLVVMTGTLLLAITLRAQADEAPAPPSPGAAAFAEGTKLAREGKDARSAFRRALKEFLREDHVRSAADFQNIGNAAFLAGDLPRAIWAFRSGLILDPHDRLLSANLAYVRGQVQYPPGPSGRPEPDFWPPLLPRLPAAVWALVAAAGYTLGCVALTVRWLGRRAGLFLVAAGCMAVAGVAGYGWYLGHAQYLRDRDQPVLVIRTNDVPLRTGNGESYPRHAELPTLREGMEARRVTQRGPWLQVRLASGEIGWVRDADTLEVGALP